MTVVNPERKSPHLCRCERIAMAMKCMVRARQELNAATRGLPKPLAEEIKRVATTKALDMPNNRSTCLRAAFELVDLAWAQFKLKARHVYNVSDRDGYTRSVRQRR
jgi:hypothetical protein